MTEQEREQFHAARDEFINRWGELGTQWGINRTMAQVHALLMISPEALSTDQVMAELHISRGNAHTSLKELVGWDLLKILTKKGDRKEYFEAEKDVWKIFQAVAKERKRREIDPALQVLHSCSSETKGIKGSEVEAFHNQMNELAEFASLASNLGDKAASMAQSNAVKLALKILGG